MKRILSSVNGRLSTIPNNNENKTNKKNSENIKEKIKKRQEHDTMRHKRESDDFIEKLKTIRPMTARKVINYK